MVKTAAYLISTSTSRLGSGHVPMHLLLNQTNTMRTAGRRMHRRMHPTCHHLVVGFSSWQLGLHYWWMEPWDYDETGCIHRHASFIRPAVNAAFRYNPSKRGSRKPAVIIWSLPIGWRWVCVLLHWTASRCWVTVVVWVGAVGWWLRAGGVGAVPQAGNVCGVKQWSWW